MKKKSFKSTKSLSARNEKQKEYIKSIITNDITVCIGPAGCGKSCISTYMALQGLRTNKVDRIVITRSVVDAGESLGYLPGEIEEKLLPYLRPVYDELIQWGSREEYYSMKQSGELEICPIAYMQGRTFNNSFIIVEEAQNLTFDQMKMVITRLGDNSKLIISGDISQSFLPHHKQNALLYIFLLFDQLENVGCIRFDDSDIVRNPMLEKMLKLWDENLDKFQKTGIIT